MKLIKVLFDNQWDINVLARWFLENEQMIKKEIAPDEIKNVSLAKGISKFYDDIDFDRQEDALSRVFEYRTRHGLRFALRGVDVDDYYIGSVNNKTTISICNDKEEWAYDVNLEEFFKKMRIIQATL